MFELILAFFKLPKNVGEIVVLIGNIILQLNEIRFQLKTVEKAVMNLDPNIDGPDDLTNNPLAPESEIENGSHND